MHYKLNTNVVYVEQEGEMFLLHVETGMHFNLKGAILQVFSNLIDGASLDDMTVEVSTHFDIPDVTSRDDLKAVLDKLCAADLVLQTS